jgi:putative hydrolase of HD superfamily
MVREDLLQALYNAAEMQRWNDKQRPVPLTELDKQAHKMTTAFVLDNLVEDPRKFDWTKLIEGGLFEYFQRLTLTDIKPQIFEEIKGDRRASSSSRTNGSCCSRRRGISR